ncbi:MAG: hypothetical protein FJZ01_25540 [Candidatus Sericytochromatia bacterium]|nr:hypothetical protein [Candidatus Tanganyikabacteria bacterium]
MRASGLLAARAALVTAAAGGAILAFAGCVPLEQGTAPGAAGSPSPPPATATVSATASPVPEASPSPAASPAATPSPQPTGGTVVPVINL